MIGDLVRFINVEDRLLKITGRIKQFLSLCGEHLSLDNINTAIHNISEQQGIEITEFSLFPQIEEQRHSWFIGVNEKLDTEKIINLIDKELRDLNDDYNGVRKVSLQPPILKALPVETFYNFMETIGKAGSQNKFPRVMNEQQSALWLNFLSNQGLL